VTEKYDPEREREALAAGQEDAWQRLLRACLPRMESIGFSELSKRGVSGKRARDVLDDVVQETLILAYERSRAGKITRHEMAFCLDRVRRLVWEWQRTEARDSERIRSLAEERQHSSPFGRIVARDEAARAFRRLRRSFRSLERSVVEESREARNVALRSSPFLHLAVLDLSARGVRTLRDLGGKLGIEDVTQLSRLRAAATDRLATAAAGTPVPSLESQEFGEVWKSAFGGCLLDLSWELPAEHPSAGHLAVQRRAHEEHCEACREAKRPLPEERHAPRDLARYLRVTVSRSIAAWSASRS